MEGYDVWGLFQKMLVGGQVASAVDGMGLATAQCFEGLGNNTRVFGFTVLLKSCHNKIFF